MRRNEGQQVTKPQLMQQQQPRPQTPVGSPGTALKEATDTLRDDAHSFIGVIASF